MDEPSTSRCSCLQHDLEPKPSQTRPDSDSQTYRGNDAIVKALLGRDLWIRPKC